MRSMQGQVAGGELFEHAHYLQRTEPVGQSGLSRGRCRRPPGMQARCCPTSYRRLQQVNAVYDPGHVIIFAHPAWSTRP